MDQNLEFFNLYSSYFYPSQTFIPVIPSVIPQVFQPKTESITVISSQKEKYQRTWTKPELENVFNSTVEYCQKQGKAMKDLRISDFAIISIGKRQTPEQIMIKMQEVKSNGTLRPGRWSSEEDLLLINLIEAQKSNWGRIAQILNNEVHNKLNIRNSKTCKERWNNYLNPGINRGDWTREEDILLFKGYLQYGNKWKSITKLIPNRIEGAIKNRIKSLIHKLRQEMRSSEDIMIKIKEICKE